MAVNRIAKRVTQLRYVVALTPLLVSAVADAQGPPIGYERLALHSPSQIETGVFEKESYSFVLENFAKTLTGFGLPIDDSAVNDKRLIDIEVNVSGGQEAKVELSGVWIENEGYFSQESWLTLGHPASDLIDWPAKKAYIPVDIERYYANGGEDYFAVIWQKNRHEVDWSVELEASSMDILRRVDEGFRVVDFDQFRKHFDKPFTGSDQFFDAILVENNGANYLEAVWKPISANPLDTHVLYNSFELEPTITFIPLWFPEFLPSPAKFVTRYEGFDIFDAEKIVDVEFVEFPESLPDVVFPETWALVVSHPVPDCRSIVSEGVLHLVAGVASYHAEHDVGRVIDYEGTAPFQNRPEKKPSVHGHNAHYYGPPGFAAFPTYIHGCKRIIPY